MSYERKQTPPSGYNLIPPHRESLNEPSEAIPIDAIGSPEIQGIIDRMFEIGIGEQGDPKHPTLVGLAAPQIGINKRIVLVGVDALGNGAAPELQAFINPVIIGTSSQFVAGREGCFSTDRVCGIVDRAETIALQAFDRAGAPITFVAQGFPARIFQHELDHLDGIRFPDRITDPTKLHWVPKAQFADYRRHWETWQNLCPPEQWQAIKNGEALGQ